MILKKKNFHCNTARITNECGLYNNDVIMSKQANQREQFKTFYEIQEGLQKKTHTPSEQQDECHISNGIVVKFETKYMTRTMKTDG